MTYIITSLCLRDAGCIEVCPVECIVPGDPVEEWPIMPKRLSHTLRVAAKKSGYGKDLSAYSLDDYTRIKHVMANLDS